MQNSYLGLWKELCLQTVLESDPQKLTELVLASEQAMADRARQFLSSSDQHEERSEMAIAKASLLSIKTHKLGWPPVPSSGGLH